jgi:hypothetical protein
VGRTSAAGSNRVALNCLDRLGWRDACGVTAPAKWIAQLDQRDPVGKISLPTRAASGFGEDGSMAASIKLSESCR